MVLRHRFFQLFHLPFSVTTTTTTTAKNFIEETQKMAESKSTAECVREWVSEHKLRTVGCLWLSGIAGSIAYNWSQPNMKTSVRIIHARLHAQALTLAALAGAAVVEYYESRSGVKADRYSKYFPPMDAHAHKD